MGLGGGGGAAKAAAATEAQRQSDIKSGVGRVNSIFDSPDRAAQRQQFLQSLTQQLTGQVNDQKQIATRKLKFANARNGTIGGSQDVDSNQVLQQDYSKGLLDASRKAQGSFADLVQSDSTERNNLVSLVQNGLDTGTAAQRAGEALQGNLQKSQAMNPADGAWDVFSNTGKLWQTAQDQAERRKGYMASSGGLYGNGGGNPWSN